MKLIKSLSLLLLVFVCPGLFAQTVSFHGYADYTTMGLGQKFYTQTDGEKQKTDLAAEYGSFYNGRTDLNCHVDASNVHFVLGIRLDASLGPWYDSYNTADDGEGGAGSTTYFYQGNIRIDLLKDQIHVYGGKFEEWNNGYIADGYVMEGQNIRNLADRSQGQHFTGIEYSPYQLQGFRIIFGYPILPVAGNGVDSAEYNTWENLAPKFKIMTSMQTPWSFTVNAGLRPETHYEGTKNYSSDSYFGESFIQIDSPKLTSSIAANASYDLRWRKQTVDDKYTAMHYLQGSAKWTATDSFSIALENRFAYADDRYVNDSEKLLYDSLGLLAEYKIPMTMLTAGLKTIGTFAADANGTLFQSEGRISSNYCDDFAMTTDWMPYADTVSFGESGNYYGIYIYPYVRRDFKGGCFKTGIEMQYTYYITSEHTDCFGYRIPLGIELTF